MKTLTWVFVMVWFILGLIFISRSAKAEDVSSKSLDKRVDRIMILTGYGPAGLQVDKNGETTTYKTASKIITGIHYSHTFHNDLNVGFQMYNNGLLSVGVGWEIK